MTPLSAEEVEEIERRAKAYRRKHPEWELTGPALAKHWASLSGEVRPTAGERRL